MATMTSTTVEPGISAEMLENSYLIPQYDLHLFPDMAYVYPPDGRKYFRGSERDDKPYFRFPEQKYPVKLHLRQMNTVNGTGKDLYHFCDGSKTGEDLYREVLDTYNEPYGTMKDSIYRFMEEMVRRKHVLLSDEPQQSAFTLTGSEEYFFPPHVAIEVTAMCNIKCIHCYGSFEQKRFDQLDADRLIEMLEDMKSKGLSSVELTGGECTTHPQFARILRWCCDNLHMIGVLTNAVNIREEVFELLIKHADKVTVQICINGNEDYHNEFTKSRIAYRRAMKAVERLAAAGVFVRTPMNVTFDNLEQIEETFDAVLAAGSSSWQVNLVDHAYGRASDMLEETTGESDCGDHEHAEDGSCCQKVGGLTCKERMDHVINALDAQKKLQKRFPSLVTANFTKNIQKQMDYERSCGAGRRVVYIGSNGKVGLCPMAVETGVPGFGDLTRSEMGHLMDSNFAEHLAGVPAPNETDCDGCPRALEHRGCILRGMMQVLEDPESCQWGKKHHVQEMLQKGDSDLSINGKEPWTAPEMESCQRMGCGAGAGIAV